MSFKTLKPKSWSFFREGFTKKSSCSFGFCPNYQKAKTYVSLVEVFKPSPVLDGILKAFDGERFGQVGPHFLHGNPLPGHVPDLGERLFPIGDLLGEVGRVLGLGNRVKETLGNICNEVIFCIDTSAPTSCAKRLSRILETSPRRKNFSPPSLQLCRLMENLVASHSSLISCRSPSMVRSLDARLITPSTCEEMKERG